VGSCSTLGTAALLPVAQLLEVVGVGREYVCQKALYR
jgi:hypothetical protein